MINNSKTDEVIFEIAKYASHLATDLRKPIGVIITDLNNNPVAFGYNKATLNLRPFNEWHKTNCLRKIFNTPKNKMYWFCPGCAVNENHAERVAIRNIPFTTEKKEYIMYLYGHTYCCEECLKHIKNANIKEIKFYGKI